MWCQANAAMRSACHFGAALRDAARWKLFKLWPGAGQDRSVPQSGGRAGIWVQSIHVQATMTALLALGAC